MNAVRRVLSSDAIHRSLVGALIAIALINGLLIVGMIWFELAFAETLADLLAYLINLLK